MSKSISEEDVKSLNELTESLGRNSKVAAPFFALGILATLVGAGIAIYFIVNLSAKLEDAQEGLTVAQIELTQSQAALEDANRSLEEANTALGSSQSSQSESKATEDSLERAIMQVTKSQEGLAGARTNVSNATIALPSQGKRVAQQTATGSLSGEWVDGYGSLYVISQEGREFRYTVRFLNTTGADSGIQGTAIGTITGGEAAYNFQDNVNRNLKCRGEVSKDLNAIVETCRYPDGREVSVTLLRT